MAIISLSDTAN